MPIIQTPSIAAVVEDQSPQLGGDLECQDYQITDVGLLQWYDDTLPYQAQVLFGNTLYFTPTVNTSAKYLFRGAGSNKNLQHSILSSEIITYIGSDQSLHTYRGQNASLRYRWRAGDGSNVNAELGTDYLELKDGANPFTQTIFNTYTDASNFEALSIGWDTNVASIATTAAGTGTLRKLVLGSSIFGANTEIYGGGYVRLYDGASLQVNIDSGYATFYNNGIRPSTDSARSNGITSQRWLNTYTDTITIGDGVDAVLTADADNTLALRNSTTAQQFNVYNTYTDASNYERLEVKWDTNVATIEPTAAGTGTVRNLRLGDSSTYLEPRPASGQVSVSAGGSTSFICLSTQIQFYKAILPNNDATSDLGTTSKRWATTHTHGIATNVETFTAASDTLNDKNNVALCDCSTNAITINLPAASTASGLQYHIKKTDATANTVTIDPNGTETIDGSLTKVISTQYNSITVVSDGSNWFII